MSRKKPAHGGKPAMDLIEEATQLVLRAPASVLAAYYVGAVPALLGMLYFFSDMTRSPFARTRLLEAALVVALLYIWRKCWQSVFAAGLHATLQGESAARWDAARIARLLHVQATVQPSGLFARLISAQIIIPYVWVYSFYQNVGVIGEGKKLSVILSEAARQARLWPRQAHYAIGLLLCFALVIALNIGVALFVAPQLLKMFFGIETEFSKSPMSLLNTTVFATIAALTYLAFDPVRKAVFVVRCFYGGALKSGRDLRVQVRQMRGRTSRAAFLLWLFVLIAAGNIGPLRAAEASPAAASTEQLDASIERVLQRREFTWRLPRSTVAPEKRGVIAGFIHDFFTILERRIKMVFKWVMEMIGKLVDFILGPDTGRDISAFTWTGRTARPALYAAIAFGVILVGLVFWRKRRRKTPVTIASAVEASVPDLHSEELVADQLPEDEWMRLAAQLVQAGDLRLALRASYLAGLAHLGQRHLISIAKHKSNWEYDRELRRRARTQAELIGAFDENLRAFERVWYGTHAVDEERLLMFNRNLEQIRAC
jgi:hypothetical protein